MKLFTDNKEYYTTLFRLSTRIFLQNLMVFFTNFSDSIMLSKVGDAAVSGTYLCSTITTALQTFLTAFEGGILVLGSHLFGKKDLRSIRTILSYALFSALLLGGIFNIALAFFPRQILSFFSSDSEVLFCGCDYISLVCFSYLPFCISQILISGMRSVQVTGLGTASSLLSLTLKIGLNYILIGYTPSLFNMGIRGAGLATLISRIAECVMCVVYTFFIDKKFAFRIPHLFLQKSKLVSSYFRCVLPIFCGQAIWSVDLFAASAILGRISREVIFAASVANTLNGLAFVLINAVSNAVGLIIGKAVGEGKKDLIKSFSRTSQLIFALLGLILSSMILLFQKSFLSLYGEISPLSAEYSLKFLFVLALSIIPTSYEASSSVGILRATGDVWFTPIVDLILVPLLVIPLSLIAQRLSFAPNIVFLCLKADHFIKPFAVFLRFKRLEKRYK